MTRTTLSKWLIWTGALTAVGSLAVGVVLRATELWHVALRDSGAHIHSLSFSPDGKTLVGVGSRPHPEIRTMRTPYPADDTVYRWNVKTSAGQAFSLPATERSSRFPSTVVSRDGRLALRDRTIWRLRDDGRIERGARLADSPRKVVGLTIVSFTRPHSAADTRIAPNPQPPGAFVVGFDGRNLVWWDEAGRQVGERDFFASNPRLTQMYWTATPDGKWGGLRERFARADGGGGTIHDLILLDPRTGDSKTCPVPSEYHAGYSVDWVDRSVVAQLTGKGDTRKGDTQTWEWRPDTGAFGPVSAARGSEIRKRRYGPPTVSVTARGPGGRVAFSAKTDWSYTDDAIVIVKDTRSGRTVRELSLRP